MVLNAIHALIFFNYYDYSWPFFHYFFFLIKPLLECVLNTWVYICFTSSLFCRCVLQVFIHFLHSKCSSAWNQTCTIFTLVLSCFSFSHPSPSHLILLPPHRTHLSLVLLLLRWISFLISESHLYTIGPMLTSIYKTISAVIRSCNSIGLTCKLITGTMLHIKQQCAVRFCWWCWWRFILY